MMVRFRDLRVVDHQTRMELHQRLDEVLSSGMLMMGKETQALEKNLAVHAKRSHCIAVASGTSALHLALSSLPIPPRSPIVVPSLSWVATANAVITAGHIPVFVDVDIYGNLDPSALAAVLDRRPIRAAVVVNYAGLLARWSEIEAITTHHGCFVIEDAAQSLGAAVGSRPSGCFGWASCLSLNPMKPVGGLGEAGAVLTNSDEVADTIRRSRYLGYSEDDGLAIVELNHKIDEIQASFLNVLMPRHLRGVGFRQALASEYTSELAGFTHSLLPLAVDPGASTSFDYVVTVENPDLVVNKLANRGIEIKRRPRLALPDEVALSGFDAYSPETARDIAQHAVSLPMHSHMQASDVERVAAELKSVAVPYFPHKEALPNREEGWDGSHLY